MDNTFEKIETSSSEDSENDSTSSEESNEGLYQSSQFINLTNKKDYEKNRNILFTKDTETINIVVQKRTTDANFKINFDTDLKINPIKNVIGFNLLRASIKHSEATYLLIDLIVFGVLCISVVLL